MPSSTRLQGHWEFPNGNSREFGTPRFPVGNSREFHNSCYRLWNIIFFKGNEAVDAHFLARNSVIRYCTCILPILPSFQASSRQPCNKVPRSRPPARALPKVPRTAHVRVDMSQAPSVLCSACVPCTSGHCHSHCLQFLPDECELSSACMRDVCLITSYTKCRSILF